MELKIEKDKLLLMEFEIKMLDEELDSAIKEQDKNKVYEITDNIKKLKDIAYEQKRRIILHIQKDCSHDFIYLKSSSHGISDENTINDATGVCVCCSKQLESGYKITYKDFMKRSLKSDDLTPPLYSYGEALLSYEKLSRRIGVKNITLELLDKKAKKIHNEKKLELKK